MTKTLVAERLDIPEVILVSVPRFGDARGFFSETYKSAAFRDLGITETFVQDNHSLSQQAGVVRGLHFQKPPHAQGKLIRVVRGKILDVAVDIRKGSPTFGQHVTAELSAENWQQLWVPAGFAHGFCTLTEDTEVVYKVTSYYAPESDAGIVWDDPELAIRWPVAQAAAVLSEKDLRLPRLAELEACFTYSK